jgi:hypothetical protein
MMARPKSAAPRPTAPEPADAHLRSDSVLVGPFKLSGLARTSNGWTVAVVELDADGKPTGPVQLGRTQAFPDFVAQELVRRQMALNQETLLRYPWRPGS